MEFLKEIIMKQVSEKIETLIIPKGYFVSHADFDCENPYIELVMDDATESSTIKVFVPEPLAYYLSTHYCGSQKMHDNITDNAKRSIQDQLRNILGMTLTRDGTFKLK